jgi:hypothetical protein
MPLHLCCTLHQHLSLLLYQVMSVLVRQKKASTWSRCWRRTLQPCLLQWRQPCVLKASLGRVSRAIVPGMVKSLSYVQHLRTVLAVVAVVAVSTQFLPIHLECTL